MSGRETIQHGVVISLRWNGKNLPQISVSGVPQTIVDALRLPELLEVSSVSIGRDGIIAFVPAIEYGLAFEFLWWPEFYAIHTPGEIPDATWNQFENWYSEYANFEREIRVWLAFAHWRAGQISLKELLYRYPEAEQISTVASALRAEIVSKPPGKRGPKIGSTRLNAAQISEAHAVNMLSHPENRKAWPRDKRRSLDAAIDELISTPEDGKAHERVRERVKVLRESQSDMLELGRAVILHLYPPAPCQG